MTEQIATRVVADIEPNLHFDAWDQTPHFYTTVPVDQVALGDVILGGTHQIEGFGRAEQRGAEARRFDLEYIVGQSSEHTARLVLPLDHLLEVKRYTFPLGHRWAVTRLHGSAPRLTPDYGKNTHLCCSDSPSEVNADGYEKATTICDTCADSWRLDYEVLRHR